MDLILWRHAEAEDIASSDLARELTAKGKKQARAMADWLHAHLKGRKHLRLVASGAVRSQQTLAAFEKKFEIDERINPGSSAQNYLAVAGLSGIGSGTAILVGHQPEIGRVASLLLTGREVECDVKKGAIWWLQCRNRDGVEQYLLRAMMTPQMLAGK